MSATSCRSTCSIAGPLAAALAFGTSTPMSAMKSQISSG